MSRLPFIAGNWKMNGDIPRTRELCSELVKRSSGWADAKGRKVDVAVFPPLVSLMAAAEALRGSAIMLGAQNMHEASSGAFTGEVSGSMLLTAGCQFVILGHSERRQYFGETDAGINRKALAALAVGLKLIVCVGELLEDREAGRTHEVVERQLAGGLKGLTEAQLLDLTIAYEPVWAIGTGRTASPEQAQEVHAFLRGRLTGLLGSDAAAALRIQYGGSVKPDNAATLLAQPDIDGALVGGASLDVEAFSSIIAAAPRLAAGA